MTELANPLPHEAADRRGVRGPKHRGRPLNDTEFQEVLHRELVVGRTPESSAVMLLLAHEVGAMPCEIAALECKMLFDDTGQLLNHVILPPIRTRYCGFRQFTMGARLRHALTKLFNVHPAAKHVAFVAERSGAIRYLSAEAVRARIVRAYQRAGLSGCSGLSGRHSFWESLSMKMDPTPTSEPLPSLDPTAMLQSYGNRQGSGIKGNIPIV